MNITILSDVTFEPVLKYLKASEDIVIKKYLYTEAMVPELLHAGKDLQQTDILFIHFDSYFHRHSDEYILDILEAINKMAADFTGTILVSNNTLNRRHDSVLKQNAGQNEQFLFTHTAVFQKLLDSGNVFLFDIRKIIYRSGTTNAYNFKLGFLYQMPYTKHFIELFSAELLRYLRFLSASEKKAIFIDCDNTLWKGILGEDGIEGIQCNKNANGILFFHLQEFLLQKKTEGFILGLCSKNNEKDVQEAFEKLNMPLKWEDFLIKKVNWKDKVENLKEVSETLNIGLASFIFIDDNDFEIQSVNSLIPEVKTIRLKDDYDSFLELCDDYSFKRKRLTKEDLAKNEQYIAEQKRDLVKQSNLSFEDYVASLQIRLDITVNNPNDLARLSQLTEKTNQFNFNKEMFNIPQLQKFLGDGNFIFGLRVADKFGDYGLVGLILIEAEGKAATLRNFLMSCRVLGRSVENDFFNYVVTEIENKGLKLEKIIFKETSKNFPAKEFYGTLMNKTTV